MKNQWFATCEDDFFRVEGTNKKEVAEILKAHVKKHHGMKLSDREALRSVMTC